MEGVVNDVVNGGVTSIKKEWEQGCRGSYLMGVLILDMVWRLHGTKMR